MLYIFCSVLWLYSFCWEQSVYLGNTYSSFKFNIVIVVMIMIISIITAGPYCVLGTVQRALYELTNLILFNNL